MGRPLCMSDRMLESEGPRVPYTSDTVFDNTPDVEVVDPGWPSPIPISIGTLTGAGAIIGGSCRLMGWALRETTGLAAAEIDIFSGSNSTGILVGGVQLGPNESTREWFGPAGIRCNGLACNVTSGSVSGTLFVVPE